MKMNWPAAAVFAASLWTVFPSAHAQSAAATPAKKELIQRLLVLQQPGVEALARSLAEQPAAEMMPAVRQLLQTRVPADKRQDVSKAIDADFRKYLDEAVPILRDQAVKLAPSTIGAALDEKFTEDELKQLVSWFESPVSKKFQQTTPQLQTALVQKLVADTRPAVETKLKALDQSVTQRLGLPPAGSASAPVPAAPASTSAPTKK